MHNANIPDHAELPTTAKLIKSTIIAIIAAAVILVTLVLPAEFGIDPTGIGKLTGLQRMGEIKAALDEELAASQSQDSAGSIIADESIPAQTAPKAVSLPRTDKLAVTLAPNKSTEVKITMTKGDSVEFTWSTNTGQAFYDLHADSRDVDYHSYEKGTESTKQGTLTAAFDGNHGWYWKNRTGSTMTITINTSGTYQGIKQGPLPASD